MIRVPAALRRRDAASGALSEARLSAWGRRVPTLRGALEAAPGDLGEVRRPADLGALLGSVVDVRRRDHVWLALAVLTGRLPDRTTVVEVARACQLDGDGPLWEAVGQQTTDASATWEVRVAVDEVIVDVAHTSSTPLATGIQRVARETTRRWLTRHDCTLVAWTPGFESMRLLTPVERSRITGGQVDRRADEPVTVVVPWHGTYVAPELAAEHERSARLLALAELTGNRTGVIGFDCVPLTSAETTQLGFAGVFAGNLAAVRYFDRVATISDAAATEYGGWRASLPAIGMTGPDIRSIALPVEAEQATEEDTAAARTRFVVGRLPLVLVVGSHEPRKNHLAVLHAAELLWREGVRFSLSFVGGNSWGSDTFTQRLRELQAMGRPVDSESRLADGQLWAAYRLARCTVFPSLNEGFGLPVAESLAVGTPAITSDFGSMAQLAADGGALTVDPHDDHAIAGALRRLLTDDELARRLRAEALARPPRSWDTYADEVWNFLVRGRSSRTGG